MATRMTIEMNYNQAVRQAKQLETLAGNLKKIQNELQDSMNGLSRGWEGDASDAYRRKGSRLAEKVRKDADQLNQAAAAIRNIAKRTRRAELESIRIAEQRKYR